jgi:glutamate 5-kinase
MEDLRSQITIGTTNSFGTGGMGTKLEAAERLIEYGIPMILANGSHEKILEKLADGSKQATLFYPS